jgi:predicted NBD/HSP70 family sugar kinase
MDIKTIGIDLGKTVCDAVAMDGSGKVLARRRLTRPKVALWLANPAAVPDRRAAPIIWRAG